MKIQLLFSHSHVIAISLKSHLHLLEIQNNYWENDDRIYFCEQLLVLFCSFSSLLNFSLASSQSFIFIEKCFWHTVLLVESPL